MEAFVYRHGDIALTGWLARPATEPKAAIVLYPTIANRDSAMDRRALMLTEQGFLVMIADHYGVVPQSPEQIHELANELRSDPQHYRSRATAAFDALREHVGSLPIAAVGYCLGGQAALEAARGGCDLVLAASFHGLLNTAMAAEPGVITARMLILHGDADPLVPRDSVIAFFEEMDRAGGRWHFHAYSGVRHGFTDPQSDLRDFDAVAYDASADRQSWRALLDALEEVLEETP